MTRQFSIMSIMLVLFMGGAASIAKSAQISTERHGRILTISGEIVTGDAEKMIQSFSKEKYVILVKINSPGGDLAESLRIADLLKGMRVQLNIPSGNICASSCFFIFIAAQSRFASGGNQDGTLPPSARKGDLGYIGIHRPYLKHQGVDESSMRKQDDLTRKVKDELIKKQIPQRLVDLMMSRPSNGIYWLTNDDLDLIGEYDSGMEEALIKECGYKRWSAINREGWSKEQLNKMLVCAGNFTSDSSRSEATMYLAKLQTGWRPWKK